MCIHLRRELEKLKRRILQLSSEVEEDVYRAVQALDTRNQAMAEEVIAREQQTNIMEVEVEEECLKLLALYQPVAADLRYIIAVLKINQDLERIGDLAVHIAECSLELCRQPEPETPIRLSDMANKTQLMLKKVLDAFVNQDKAAAHEVCITDHVVDNMKNEIFRQAKIAIRKNPEQCDTFIEIMNVARHLERIADHATNIAEDLIYLIAGRIVRHTPEVSDKMYEGYRGDMSLT
ncbi:MAG: phosphate signaling complex protein PhoU [Kiritimatiellia bacterium]|jgi:phosphate transport system protein